MSTINRLKARRVATENLRRKPSAQPMEPKTARDKLFCERWLTHRDHHRAWREAGFAPRSDKELPLAKLARFRPYLERLQPKVELLVAKKISVERHGILAAISNIGNANVLDYIIEVPNAATGVPEWRLKPLHKLTRDQASAIDTVFWDPDQGRIGYTLPATKTRLSALTTLSEQVASFSKKNEPPNHLHIAQNVPLDKIRQLKQLFIDAMGPQVTREVLGIAEEEQPQ